MAVNGVALGALAAGSVFVYAGVKGYSIPQAIQSIVQGKAPTGLSKTNQIAGTPASAASSTSTTGNPTAPVSGSKKSWIVALLTSLGAPSPPANINSMSAWISKETPWPPVASNNPLNSTLPEGGASDYNSVGVKNYPNASIGMQATVATLQGYPGIVSALKSGNGLCGGGLASEFLKWSGGGYSSVC